ncbi:hypothetical protein SAY86_015478 [Trapa natans]|uniref:non-specific serine/threonine protein kinase n=1 Tax=Trapa natans TaxID=22666 RepID=A0AAN7L8M5_TRANT|nr:hypothetical protein SAY86_015478 [Trapa natans]
MKEPTYCVTSYRDLSFNNFTGEGANCTDQDGNVNLFASSSVINSSETVSCLRSQQCNKSLSHLRIDCGGTGTTTYSRDDKNGTAAHYYKGDGNNWAYSNTGQFMDNRDIEQKYIRKLVLKDFNIEDAAGGVGKPVIKSFMTDVTDSSLEIRFQWAGRGTTGVPYNGVYGPLISAINAFTGSDTGSTEENKEESGSKLSAGEIFGIVAGIAVAIFLIIFILWRKGCLAQKSGLAKDFEGLQLQTGSFTLRQIKVATDNFSDANKIGEGGFGPVHKAQVLKQRGKLMDLVDRRLGSDFNKDEVMAMINVALLCTFVTPLVRPTMSSVVRMLHGDEAVPEVVPDSSVIIDDVRLEVMRRHFMGSEGEEEPSERNISSVASDLPLTASSSSSKDLYPAIVSSDYWQKRI